MEIHYCMGKKLGVDFYAKKSDKCKRCGMTEKKGGCCSDEHQFFKIEDLHKNSSCLVCKFHAPDCMASKCFIEISSIEYSVERHSEEIIGAPIISSPPMYIRNCIFRL